MRFVDRRPCLSLVLGCLLCWAGAATAQEANWPRSIVLGTASPGGAYVVYGQGLGRILSEKLGIEISAQATQGPAQNIVLMERKEALLGLVTMGVALQGWNGTEWARGTRYRSMRAIFPMYDTAFHFTLPKRLGLKSLNDFAGLLIGAGPRAGTGGTYVPQIFKTLGIDLSIRFGPWEQLSAQTTGGELHGVVFVGGMPFPALAQLDAVEPLQLVEPTQEQVAAIRQQMPELTPSLVPAGTYKSQTEDYRTIGQYNFAIAHKDLPDELIYRLVKTVFENQPELVKALSAAKETLAVHIDRNTFLPLHPGAVRYYREQGIAVPTGLLEAGN